MLLVLKLETENEKFPSCFSRSARAINIARRDDLHNEIMEWKLLDVCFEHNTNKGGGINLFVCTLQSPVCRSLVNKRQKIRIRIYFTTQHHIKSSSIVFSFDAKGKTTRKINPCVKKFPSLPNFGFNFAIVSYIEILNNKILSPFDFDTLLYPNILYISYIRSRSASKKKSNKKKEKSFARFVFR